MHCDRTSRCDDVAWYDSDCRDAAHGRQRRCHASHDSLTARCRITPTSRRSRSWPARPTTCRSIAAAERRADAGERVSQDRRRRQRVLVRERHRRREGRPLQLSRGRAVSAARSARQRDDHDVDQRAASSEHERVRRPTNPLDDAARASAGDPRREAAGAAAVRRRRRRLRGLRHGSLRRESAERAARRPRACPTCRSRSTTTWSCSTTCRRR